MIPGLTLCRHSPQFVDATKDPVLSQRSAEQQLEGRLLLMTGAALLAGSPRWVPSRLHRTSGVHRICSLLCAVSLEDVTFQTAQPEFGTCQEEVLPDAECNKLLSVCTLPEILTC